MLHSKAILPDWFHSVLCLYPVGQCNYYRLTTLYASMCSNSRYCYYSTKHPVDPRIVVISRMVRFFLIHKQGWDDIVLGWYCMSIKSVACQNWESNITLIYTLKAISGHMLTEIINCFQKICCRCLCIFYICSTCTL